MRISDWSSDVCSSDLRSAFLAQIDLVDLERRAFAHRHIAEFADEARCRPIARRDVERLEAIGGGELLRFGQFEHVAVERQRVDACARVDRAGDRAAGAQRHAVVERSEEHTSELQSLMRISYAVFCLKKKKPHQTYKTR